MQTPDEEPQPYEETPPGAVPAQSPSTIPPQVGEPLDADDSDDDKDDEDEKEEKEESHSSHSHTRRSSKKS